MKTASTRLTRDIQLDIYGADKFKCYEENSKKFQVVHLKK
jgi:hypothetical protein